jgi:hypothetical protein
MLTPRTIIIALALFATTLSACGNRQSNGAITQLDLNKPNPTRPASPPEQGALVMLDDAIPVGKNDACHATYYTKRTPEEAIIAVNGLFKTKGFRVNPNSRLTQSMSNMTNEAWIMSRTGRDVTFINAVYPTGYEFNQEWDPMQGVATDTVVQIVYKQYLDDEGNCTY